MLGTASAMPVSDRNPSAQALQMRGRFFLVDCGEGTQRQMVRYGVSLQKIEAIFISHIHGDHVYGLEGYLSTQGMSARQAPLDIYGPRNLGPMLKFFLSYNEWIGYEIRFHPLDLTAPTCIWESKSAQVFAFPLNHGVETYGYIFREKEPLLNVDKEALDRYGFTLTEIGSLKRGEDIVRDGMVIPCKEVTYRPYAPRSYAYVSDTAVFPEEVSWLQGVDVIYHETTYLEEHAEKAAKRHHSTTRQAAVLARDAGARKLLIGHYSSRNRDASLYEKECREIFPETYAASDGEVYEI